MKSAALLLVPRLTFASRPIAVALLILLLPAAAVANRPRIRPHHHVPPNWREIVARSHGSVRIDFGTSSSEVSSGASINFAVSGASMTSASSAAATTRVFSGTLALSNPSTSGDLVKNGVGTFTLNANTAYAGNTTVNAGTLSLTHALFADTAAVSLTTGATLNLNFAGTDTVNLLRIDGVAQSPGTWGSLTSDATYRTALITGTGILSVVANGGTLAVGGTNLTTTNGGTLTLAGGTATTTVGSQTLNTNTQVVTNVGTLDVTTANATLVTNPVTTGTILVINGGTLANPTLVTNQVPTGTTGSGLVTDTSTLSASAFLAPAELPDPAAPETAGGPAPVPEPSSALLMLIGAGLLSQRRRCGSRA